MRNRRVKLSEQQKLEAVVVQVLSDGLWEFPFLIKTIRMCGFLSVDSSTYKSFWFMSDKVASKDLKIYIFKFKYLNWIVPFLPIRDEWSSVRSTSLSATQTHYLGIIWFPLGGCPNRLNMLNSKWPNLCLTRHKDADCGLSALAVRKGLLVDICIQFH